MKRMADKFKKSKTDKSKTDRNTSDNIVKEGAVQKKSRFLKQWRVRWAVLKPYPQKDHHYISTFKKKRIYNQSTEKIRIDNKTRIKVHRKDDIMFSIQNKNDKEKFVFIAQSTKDRDEWIKSLQHVQRRVAMEESKQHHNGDSNYTLSSIHKTNPKAAARYYQSRQVKSTQSIDGIDANNNTDDGEEEMAKLKSSTNSSSSSSTNQHPLINDGNAAKKNLIKNKLPVSSNSPSPKPSPQRHFQSTLSPTDVQKSVDASSDEEAEREHSVSKSRSRQFRRRNEPKSSSPDKLEKTTKSTQKLQQQNQTNMDEPPEINDDDDDDEEEQLERGSNASSLSDNVEIPVLLFSDSGDEEEQEDDGDDANLKIMEYLVEQENMRLQEEISRMKSYMEEQETIKLKAEALKEIEAEAKEKQIHDAEEEKKRKALERYEKKQRQRQKEKEAAKERRRIRKEEKKKQEKAALLQKKMMQRQQERLKKRNQEKERRKKELEQYSVPEERPTRQEIATMFDKYFYRPFESWKSQQPVKEKKRKENVDEFDDSSSSEEEEEILPENGINIKGFKDGLKTLGIDQVLNKSEVRCLFEAVALKDGLNAAHFVHFLKQNTKTMEPKLAKIQRKVLSVLAKQQDKEDELEKQQQAMEQQHNDDHHDEVKENEDVKDEDDEDQGSADTMVEVVDMDDTKEEEEDDDEDEKKRNYHLSISTIPSDDVHKIEDMPIMKIQVSEPNDNIRPITPLSKDRQYNYPAPVIRPMDSMDNIGALHEDMDEDDMDEDEPIDMNQPDNGRRDSVSMSESMSMSVSAFLPSNIPRKSFKKINYNWNDAISKKSFNNYKRLREKFAFRYKHTPRKTKDEELIKIREKLLTQAINQNLAEGNEDETESELEINSSKKNMDGGDHHENEEKQEEKQDDIKDDTEHKTEQRVQIQPQQVTTSPHKPSHQHKRTGSKSLNSQLQSVNELQAIDDDVPPEHRRSTVGTSLKKIQNYKGNEEMINLRKLYKQQYKMKQKLERLRKQSLLSFPAPPKPKDISKFIDDDTRYIHKELKLCICKNTRYTGLANFGPNGELGIEIEFTSDCDDKGYITGKRVIHFKGMKQAIGKGRIWMDVVWNGHKYLPCTRFEWIDEGEGVTTKFEFDHVTNEIDVDHSFFQGKCVRYPSDLDPKKRSTKLIMHEGYFDFVCVSARRRNIRRNSLLQYHTLDINEMNDDELAKVPKYVRRMSAYTEKIDQLYEQEQIETKDTLFGDAISTVAAINETDPVTSDASLPDQINN